MFWQGEGRAKVLVKSSEYVGIGLKLRAVKKAAAAEGLVVVVLRKKVGLSGVVMMGC